ncbi:MAG: tetratricopeptide repeat protein [Sedimentisphaerales bacterium]|nr:tetratricopeptide repeat protein [Sedimentisphaerales bacterium]
MKIYARTGQRSTPQHRSPYVVTPSWARGARFLLVSLLLVGAGLPAGAMAGAAVPSAEPQRSGATSPASTTPARVTPEQTAALKKEERALVDTLLSDFPESVDATVLLSRVHYRHGNTAEAQKLWGQVLRQDPNRADVYHTMGLFTMGKGQYAQAIAHYRKALALEPQTAGLHGDIARGLMGLGRHEEAIQELQQDIKLSPRPSFSYFLLGQEYLQVDEYEKAKSSYERAIKLDPKLTNAYYGLFTVCTRLKLRDEARKHLATFKELKAEDMKVLKDRNDAFNDLVDMQRGAAETFLGAARLYQGRGDLARAEQLLVRAVTLDPQNSLCHLTHGAVAAQRKHFADAERAFREVISLAPTGGRGYCALAHLYLQLGQKPQEARQLASRAVALEPTAFNYYVLSWACDRNGDKKGAWAAIEKAVQIQPKNPLYRRVYEAIQKKK